MQVSFANAMLRIAHAVLAAALIVLVAVAATAPASAQRLDGFNVIATPDHPYGSAGADRALAAARKLGATAVAVVPFLWQPRPSSPDIVRGRDISDEQLRRAIRAARAHGLAAVVKPHVWVPGSWAGAVAPTSEQDWRHWFTAYGAALERIARIAAEEGAEMLAVGTELVKAARRPEWRALIGDVRRIYAGRLVYFAHNAEGAESYPFWPLLDAIGVTLYPPLGPDRDRSARLAAMRTAAARVERLAARLQKPVIVGEIGLRSAQGAAERPWESAEERAASPDPLLQAEVLADWLAVLRRPAVEGVLVWRWFTDPAAGGPADTDFTVQGKPAEHVLRCAWKGECAEPTTWP